MKKVKQKTKKTIAKRFKITKTGKILRGNLGKRHRKTHKSKKRYRSLKKSQRITKSQEKTLRNFI